MNPRMTFEEREERFRRQGEKIPPLTIEEEHDPVVQPFQILFQTPTWKEDCWEIITDVHETVIVDGVEVVQPRRYGSVSLVDVLEWIRLDPRLKDAMHKATLLRHKEGDLK